ncbi:MAG TPA: cysteine dioxygenase family protein [Pyrinomonadaceae bacterium]|nr:cysteine dioxygenase family protein [Pyrinomonadaceae bacterium]
MRTVPLEKLVEGLRAIGPEDFCVGNVHDFLTRHPVEESSLEPFLFFSRRQYTRHLIYKDDLFELMAVCWDVGQASLIHNHAEQNCWMSLPVGRLRVQNFRVVEQDERTGFCRVEPSDYFDLHRDAAAEVDPTEPVHQVLNLSEFDGRAVSLHVYSKPFDRCQVYSPSKNQVSEIQLCYTSQYGKLCEGARL